MKAPAIARYPASVGCGSPPLEQKKVSEQSRAFWVRTLPGPFKAANMFATRARDAAAAFLIDASTERYAGSTCASRSASGFHAPVTMISAFGAAARSCPRIALKRAANDAIALGARLPFADSGARSPPHSVTVIGLTCPG